MMLHPTKRAMYSKMMINDTKMATYTQMMLHPTKRPLALFVITRILKQCVTDFTSIRCPRNAGKITPCNRPHVGCERLTLSGNMREERERDKGRGEL